ncbi:hypothetical protein METBIDRAFT_33845 [Metschnikowia bicuspidata var. bicuspidata NRRL YB-4993]|uniref:Uncharacterized protein n=1 Tax=Metschnikowia bicuspidata var. bicuspidata NRRL YB-4993 TaxID=869754 RepID=A0A1A0GZ96_9ASCO|nr:hypothetical protein METBIDRAFT_33845 [Metschnikowia bicuspidata var. bicuspidata NRRL YB-4993]OBA17015.1 hypothetical protein METBIDRAFT_33845 [Metschnikowia bicuspidata var. bicuspidata NRRL YB-4993]
MFKIISFSIILSVVALLWLVYHSPVKEFLLETSTQFRNLVVCSDTQAAQMCWKKFGPAILALAKSSFSNLAYQLVEVCLHETESQHLHDLQFMLNVQKCFHAADFIESRSGCCSAKSSVREVASVDLWLTFLKTLLLVYLVFNVPERAILKIREAFHASYEVSTSFWKSFLAVFSPFLKVLLTSDSLDGAANSLENVYEASPKMVPPGENMGAKWHNNVQTTLCTRHEACTEKKGLLRVVKKPHNACPRVVRGCREQSNSIPATSECARDASDTETHTMCGHLDEDDRCSEGRFEVTCSQSLATNTSGKLNLNKAFLSDGELSDSTRSSHRQKLLLGPHESTSADDIEFLVSLPPSSPKEFENRIQTGSLSNLLDKNILPGAYGRPSFNISTEAGRAKMRAYVKAKMMHKIPGSLEKHSYRQLSRVDSDNQRMRRVFVANKGWIWRTRLETHGTRFVTHNDTEAPGS